MCKDGGCPNDQREKIVANIRAYITGIEADIDFCKRALPTDDPKERADIEKSIKDYEKDIQWAREQLKALAQ